MDLSTSISTGAAASLAVALILRPLWSRIAIHSKHPLDQWIPISTRTEALYLAAHAIAGATQGVLFWLSWGFAALYHLSWWTHGLIIGLSYSLLLMLPLLIACAAVIRISKSMWWLLLGETVMTCTAVGLACSWNWMQ